MTGNVNSNLNPFIQLGAIGNNNGHRQPNKPEEAVPQDTPQSNIEPKTISQDDTLNWMSQMGALNMVSTVKTSTVDYVANVDKYISPERAKDIEESMAKFEALYEQTRATTESLFGDRLSPAAIDLIAVKSIQID